MNHSEKIIWRREFDTGVAEIDEQHRTLVKMFNKARSELRDDSSRSVWENVTHEFLGYALFHFWTEEDLAAQYGYEQERDAEAAAHFAEHRAFAAEIIDLRARFRAGGCPRKADFIDFLRNWLTTHIIESDQWLVAFILDKQRQASQALGASARGRSPGGGYRETDRTLQLQ
ncbi:MAG: bacteriohemerythrin [Dechloromonas sp.]|nr:bacteriohemerythrin [Dechloromonas sp.]